MADLKNPQSLPVPLKEPIERDELDVTIDDKLKSEPRTKSYSEAASKHTQMASHPQGNSCQKTSALLIPDSIEDKSTANAKGINERDSNTMTLDTTSANTEIFSDASAHQSPPLRKSALLSTTEEFESLDDLSGFESSTISRHSYEKLYEKNMRLHHHVQHLCRKLTAVTTDKQIAERKAEKLTEKVGNMKKRLSSNMTEVERSSEALATKVNELTEENQILREQLNDAQSHIFSLQPYRKELTPKEVGQEYDALVEHVQNWVQKFMDPWLENHDEGVEAMRTSAKKRLVDANRFKRVLHQYPDLVHGCSFPETDEDVITSVIVRFLHDNIFQSVLYGAIHHHAEVISFIENQMQASVEPKRDLFSVRTWTAEAYNALLSSPQFRLVRDERRKQLTLDLAEILKIFFKKEKWQWFCENLANQVVVPAMKLYEKMQISTDHFYLDINPYIVWDEGQLTTSTEFIDSITKLDCKNVLQNRKAFNAERLDPAPSKKELYHHLLNVCTVVPALCMRQIGQRDAVKAPMVVRKQQMLVAWGSEEKRHAYQGKGDRTLVSHLYAYKGKEKVGLHS
ncbi:hypothetical protein F66182_6519 [Fusarium sp. NRRL 66182]|nr:hypothetical protein F66182_6519 [Fusarium sp. NRRL 66182]